MDPALPTQLLVGDEDLSHLGGTAGFNVSSQRFHHILHLAISSGEQEKLTQVEQPWGGPRSFPLLCCAGAELRGMLKIPAACSDGTIRPTSSRL